MQSRPDWRLTDGDGYYAGHDLVDFAQEFLARNSAYRRDYENTRANIGKDAAHEQVDMEVLARRWGLIFPFRP